MVGFWVPVRDLDPLGVDRWLLVRELDELELFVPVEERDGDWVNVRD